MDFAKTMEIIRTIADYLVIPGVYVLFSLHGRLSKIEGMLSIILKKANDEKKGQSS